MNRRISRPGWLRIFGIGLIAISAAFAANVLTDTESKAATKFTAYAGGGARGISVEMFRPKDIFIHAGDSIEWVNPYEEIHTVTFLGDEEEVPALIVPLGTPPAAGPPKLMFNPKAAFPTQGVSYTGEYANSGIIGKGQTWTQSFNDVGKYEFLCILHPGMVGSVSVLGPGTTVPTQAAYDYDAKVQLDNAVAAGEASANSTRTTNTSRPDGTTNYGVAVPASVGLSDVMRFVPLTLNIGVGDTVTWSNNTFVPHTVTYAAGGAVPELILPEPTAGGPPNLVLNPRVLFPTGAPAASFSGDSYTNSGFFGVGPESTAPPNFALTFTKPGNYLFLCVLHADQGMTSLVTVGGASGGGGRVSPPSTGDAGLAGGSGLLAVYGLGIAAIAAIAGAGSLVLSFRAQKP